MAQQSIAAATEACLISLHEVHHGDEKLQLQLARFNFWAANIGVFAPSRASLDARLDGRGGLKYRPVILQLLSAIQQNLLRLKLWRSHHGDGPQNGATSSDHGEISYSDGIQAIGDMIDRLHRLSASIRKASTRDRNSKAAAYIERDEEGNDLSQAFETNAVRIIQQMYGAASESLCRQLGHSVSLRRKRILYYRRHQTKLARGIPKTAQHSIPEIVGNINTQPLPPMPTIIESTATPLPPAAEIPIAPSVHPSETAASVPDSDTQVSTVAPSQVSSASSGSLWQDQSLRYPPAPRADEITGEYLCSFCSAVLTHEEVSSPKRWR